MRLVFRVRCPQQPHGREDEAACLCSFLCLRLKRSVVDISCRAGNTALCRLTIAGSGKQLMLLLSWPLSLGSKFADKMTYDMQMRVG